MYIGRFFIMERGECWVWFVLLCFVFCCVCAVVVAPNDTSLLNLSRLLFMDGVELDFVVCTLYSISGAVYDIVMLRLSCHVGDSIGVECTRSIIPACVCLVLNTRGRCGMEFGGLMLTGFAAFC